MNNKKRASNWTNFIKNMNPSTHTLESSAKTDAIKLTKDQTLIESE